MMAQEIVGGTFCETDRLVGRNSDMLLSIRCLSLGKGHLFCMP